MFEWVLNIGSFYSWRFHFKVNDFLNFFSTISFSYQYPPEAKANFEPSRTSTMELFREIFLKISQESSCAGVSF